MSEAGYRQTFVGATLDTDAIVSSESALRQILILTRQGNDSARLSQQLLEKIQLAGHSAQSVFWDRIDHRPQEFQQALSHCRYVVLFLTAQDATSELLTEIVRKVRDVFKQWAIPVLLSVRVGFAIAAPLNHDLSGYLRGFKQWEWHAEADTFALFQTLLQIFAGILPPLVASPSDIQIAESQPKIENESGLIPPLPIAAPELPSGQLELNSRLYIERMPIESQCFEGILQPGALIRIKAPRQMGKTSLMSRILHYASQHGCQTVSLSFQLADRRILANLDRFLQWFCASVSRQLKLPNQVQEYWDDILGANMSCTAYFEEQVLASLDQPLVLGLDEVDRIFTHADIAEDFLGLLRAWYEESKVREVWQKFRLVVVHSTEVYVPLNSNQSPFNVGLPIELWEFKGHQVWELVRLYGLEWHAEHLEQLMELIGGHPYLVQVALYHIVQHHLTLNELMQVAPTEAGPFADHLRRHLLVLHDHPELEVAIAQVVNSHQPISLESMLAFKLSSMGLVRHQGNAVSIRYELYRQYFRDRLPSLD